LSLRVLDGRFFKVLDWVLGEVLVVAWGPTGQFSTDWYWHSRIYGAPYKQSSLGHMSADQPTGMKRTSNIER